MTDDLTSTLYQSNSLIRVVNDYFEKITTGNARQDSSSETSALAPGIIPNMDSGFFAHQNWQNEIQFVNNTQGSNHEDTDQGIWTVDEVIDDFPVKYMSECNKDVFEIAMDTDSLIESLINKDSSYHSDKLAGTDNLHNHIACFGQEGPIGGGNVSSLVNCYENNNDIDALLMQKKVKSPNLGSEERHRFNNYTKNYHDKVQTKVDDAFMNYSHSERIGLDMFSKTPPKHRSKLASTSFHSASSTESNLEGLIDFSTDVFSYARPKTKEEVLDAVGKVLDYLHEEAQWTRKLARRSKIYSRETSSRKAKLSRPAMSAEVQIYVALGILPWDLKNKGCKPADDSHCQIRIPEEIKAAILRYRSWHPTMHDKLYCFENHSIYLFDLELFGCWECIRKYYNEIYKWANTNGFVLREIRE